MKNCRTLLIATYLAVALCVLYGHSQAGADQWGCMPSSFQSANGRFVLFVDEAKQTLTLKEKSTHGYKLLWIAPYPDETAIIAAPVAVYITDSGKSVVLRDQYHRVGYGKVLSFLGPKGKLLASYKLEQLINQNEIYEAKLTISSLWWSEHGLFFLWDHNTQFAVITQKGTTLLFDLATGKKLKLDRKLKGEIQKEAILLARDKLAGKESDEQETGAIITGVLHDQASLPILKKLLNDATVTAQVKAGSDPYRPFYGIQAAAGTGLKSLLGKDAIPLFKEKLKKANSVMAQHWQSLIDELETGLKVPGGI